MNAHPIDVDHVVSVCQRRCDDLGVSVRWDPYAQTARTDGKTIHLPVPPQPVDRNALDMLYGYVIHECGHHLRPEAFDILKSARPPKHLCALYNIVEDDGMERERAQAWHGDKKALARMHGLLLDKATKLMQEIRDEGTLDEQPPEPLAAMFLNNLSHLGWAPDIEPHSAALLKELPSSAQTLIDELVDEGWVDRFQATENEHDTWDLAVDLAKRLYPDNDQQEYEEMREAGHKMEQRDDSNSTMQDAQSKKQDGTDEAPASHCEGTTISWKDCVLSEHNEWSEGQSHGGIGITWEGFQSGSASLMPTHIVNVIDLPKQRGYNTGNASAYMPSDENSRSFANRIRRYIQSQARSKVRREQEQGRLDKGAIVRLGMPPIDGGEWNKRIFYDQVKHTMKDTCIFVLVDWSGSMAGSKMQYAADAAQRLVWCFDRVLHVPVALAAFSNGSTQCDIGYVKKYGTRGMTQETIAQSFAKFKGWSSGNNDADSVHWAYNEISKRKESRKILIVLSDGAPTGSFGGHASGALSMATKLIEKDKDVELYGVGVRSDAVKQYYTNYKVINDPSDINKTLFTLIKEGNNVQ